MEALAEKVASWEAVVLDCETTGIKTYLGDRLLGFGISELRPEEEERPCYYIPITHDYPKDDPAWNVAPKEIRRLAPALRGKPAFGYNVKFDLHCLRDTFGVEVFAHSDLYDVIVPARLMATEERPFLDLDTVAYRTIGFEYTSPAAGHESEFGKRKWSLQDISLKCCEDICCTAELYLHWRKHMPERLQVLYRREIRLTRILFEMERRGLRFDPTELEDVGGKLEGMKDGLLNDLQSQTEIPDFNPNSSPQVEVLMDQLHIKPRAYNKPKKDGTKSASWKREHLLAVNNPLALGIAQYRALRHETSTFIAVLDKYAAQGDDVLHFFYQNWGTVTGRLSAKEPNVQAMAKGWLQLGEVGEEGEALCWSEDGPDKTLALRTIFIPRPGYVFLDVDYSQIEMFIAGWYLAKAGDPTLLKLCEEEDVHAATARWVWGSESAEFRKRAKWFNFGLLYGLGLAGLAYRLGCTEKEAEIYREQYFRKIGPGYHRVLRNIRAWLSTRGYVENVYGRRYYLDEDRAYVAFNYTVQGSAGDFVKFRQEMIKPLCQELDIHPLLTTHDDILLEVPEEVLGSHHLKRLIDILEDGTRPFGLRLPVKVRISRTNLAEMEAYSVPAAA